MPTPSIGNLGNYAAVRPADGGQVGAAGQQQGQTAAVQQGVGQLPAFADYGGGGDTVSAQVVGVNGDSVTLQMADGSEVKAQFPPDVVVSTGDQVELSLGSTNRDSGLASFQVRSVNGQSVNLEASQLEGYLMDRGIAPTRANEAAAQVMIRNQITPTPRNVANLIEVATRLPEIPTSIAVLMADNNIPPTQENADILMKWASGPATMGQEVADLGQAVAQRGGIESFTQSLQAGIAQAQEGQAQPVPAQVILEAPGFSQLANQLAGATGDQPQQVQQAVQQFTQTIDLPPEQQLVAQNMILDAFEATTGQQIPRNEQQVAAQQPQQAATQEGQASPQQLVAEPQQQAPGAGTQQAAQQPQQAQPQDGTTRQAAEAPPKEPAQQQAQVMPDQAEQPRTEQGPRQIGMPQQNTPLVPEAVRHEASTILNSLQKMVARMRTGRPDLDGQELQESLKSQRTSAEMTKAAVSRMMGQDSPLAHRASQMSSEVRLGNQMNQFYYAQIPFQTQQQEGTAELFVFKRNPQKGEAERTQTTVLIGLDTEHMGRVETVLRSLEDKLSIQFRVASSRVQKFFQDEMRSFRQEMARGGYVIDKLEVSQLKEKTTPLNAMKVLEPEAAPARLTGFDIEV